MDTALIWYIIQNKQLIHNFCFQFKLKVQLKAPKKISLMKVTIIHKQVGLYLFMNFKLQKHKCRVIVHGH